MRDGQSERGIGWERGRVREEERKTDWEKEAELDKTRVR